MRDYLGKGYKLTNSQRSYTILATIGEGSSCVAYLASDEDSISKKYVIKEYYPITRKLVRQDDGKLFVTLQEKRKYEEGKELFIASINKQKEIHEIYDTSNQTFLIIDSFEQNNTYYVVMPHFLGNTYRHNKNLSLYDRIKVCRSVADYVNRCHKRKMLCLDIKPDNIYVLPETREFPMFFDFDSFCEIGQAASGKAVSYTEEWAAPEQILPASYGSITYATDVYILGELLFWSIFDRHSMDNEHRRLSTFSFQESAFYNDLNEDAEAILTDIFHNTIRSSVSNRYGSVEYFIEGLKLLLNAVNPDKVKILSSKPLLTPYFTGREKEIGTIRDYLGNAHKAVLSGIGGIGKSEIARKYVETYGEMYRNVLFFRYDKNIVSTISDKVFLSEFERRPEETEKHYCIRKITKLQESLTGKNLIVIDNLDIELEEAAYKEIWERILELHCDFLITSRCNQDQFNQNQIIVEELCLDDLEKIFNDYCPYDDSQKVYVDEIISSVNGHTLAAELIAKQTKNALKDPLEMLEMLKRKGILGFPEEEIKCDGEKGTVSGFIKKLFNLSGLSGTQKDILYKMTMMPTTGFSERAFCDFYELNIHSDINYLIDNGWVKRLVDNSDSLIIHPIISDITFNEMLKNQEEAKRIYSCSANAMVGHAYDAYWVDDVFYLLSRAIALRTLYSEISIEEAAEYLTRFSICYPVYGNKEELEDLLDKAIEIYDFVYDSKEYSAVREMACYQRVFLRNDFNNANQVNDYCKAHLKEANKNNDYFFKALWNIMLFKWNDWNYAETFQEALVSLRYFF